MARMLEKMSLHIVWQHHINADLVVYLHPHAIFLLASSFCSKRRNPSLRSASNVETSFLNYNSPRHRVCNLRSEFAFCNLRSEFAICSNLFNSICSFGSINQRETLKDSVNVEGSIARTHSLVLR